MCERRSVHAGVQRARSREVFGCEPVECMGAVYSRAGSRLSTRMQGECMGREIRTWIGGYQHRYMLEIRGEKRVGESVNRMIIISYDVYPWGI